MFSPVNVRLLYHLITLGWILTASAQRHPLPQYEPLTFDIALKAETSQAFASREEWPTEVWQNEVAKSLTELLKGTDEKPSWISESMPFEALRPALVKAHQLGTISIFRPQGELTEHQGRLALAAQIKNLLSPFEKLPPHIHVKVIGIKLNTAMQTFEARVLVELGATNVQQRAEWQTVWTTSLELRSIRTRFFEETRDDAPKPLLSDRTTSAFAKDSAFEQQLSLGIDDWRGRLESGFAPVVTGFFGLAVGDANGDGWEDLFLCQPHGLPNRLFIRQPDGTLKDATQGANLDLLDSTSSALFLDVDNDGDQDLLVAGDGFFIYYANNGKARFEKRQALPLSGTVTSLASADYDRDGRVDLYLCGHTAFSQQDNDTPLGLPIPIHDANNGQANILFRNTQDQGFVDVTTSVGMETNNHRFSYAASWEDFDQDGDPDLYVANDFGKNHLYRNDHGRFTDVAETLGVGDRGSGMSVSWGDVNGDGWMDLYVGNMYSSAGNRIAVRPGEQELARGNSLFLNQRGKHFERVLDDQRVHLGRWAWSSQITDLNNDGWQDLLVANGFVSNRRQDDL